MHSASYLTECWQITIVVKHLLLTQYMCSIIQISTISQQTLIGTSQAGLWILAFFPSHFSGRAVPKIKVPLFIYFYNRENILFSTNLVTKNQNGFCSDFHFSAGKAWKISTCSLQKVMSDWKLGVLNGNILASLKATCKMERARLWPSLWCIEYKE